MTVGPRLPVQTQAIKKPGPEKLSTRIEPILKLNVRTKKIKSGPEQIPSCLVRRRIPTSFDFIFGSDARLFKISMDRASDWTANGKREIFNPILTVPIKLPSSEKPTPEMKRAKVIPYFVLTQKYKTFPAIPKIIPTTAGNLPFLFIVQTQMKKVYGLQ